MAPQMPCTRCFVKLCKKQPWQDGSRSKHDDRGFCRHVDASNDAELCLEDSRKMTYDSSSMDLSRLDAFAMVVMPCEEERVAD